MTAPVHVAVGDLNTAAYTNNVDDWINGVWQAYTPALTAATTNPTLGTGSTQQGRYVQIGKFVHAEVFIGFGTSGTAAGSGIYSISLPVAGNQQAQAVVIGDGLIKCAGLSTFVETLYNTTTTATVRYCTAAVNGTLTTVTHAVPGAWTINDQLIVSFTYEAA
jgi:hypothetical protein